MQTRTKPMGKVFLTLATALLSSVSGGAQAATFVYVANADSQEISVLELDRSQGQLKPVETVGVGGTVMPMVVSPDKKYLYAALRSQPFRVTSFAIDATNGRLRKLGEAPLADSMANIDLDVSGRWLFAASFPGHKITVNSIGKDGAVGAIQQLIPTAPNAHAIHADATNRHVVATSLGGDNVSVWRFDAEKGVLSPGNPHLVASAPKAGPRHFVWDKAQRHAYLLNELDASLYVYAWDAANGTLRELQRTTALPAGFTGKPWAADLHLSPDGRHLYASERTSSTISAFRVDGATGQLQPLGQTAVEKTPRGFAIDSTGRFLLVAGQESHSVSVHPLDAATGALSTPTRLPVGKNPNWIEIVDLPLNTQRIWRPVMKKLLTTLSLALATVAATAQAWPDKTVTLVVPFPPGGSTDQVARAVAPRLADKFKQSFVIESKAGATGTIGATFVKRAAPDGNTFLVTSLGPLVIVPHLVKNMQYDALKDFDLLTVAVQSPNVLVVPMNSPHKSVADIIAYQKANPDKMTFASAGNGSSDHLTAELFWQQTGTQGVHVPYKGGAPAHTDLMGGQVDASFQNINAVVQYIKGGKMRALAITSAKRSPVLPDIPTLAEAGVQNVEVTSWQAIVAPKGLPPAVLEKAHAAFVEALNDPKVKEQFTSIGFEMVANTPAQFAAFQQREYARWKKVIETGKITIE